jgi:protein gp37
MSDLFHHAVPDEYIRRVFAVMEAADWHIFQVLTKRPRRMAALGASLPWPDHIWAGTSVELNRYTWRANHYLNQVPSAVRFVSAEPLLGPLPSLDVHRLSWVIAGGESGPRHRACDPNWIRDLRDRCEAARVAFFFKQWGGRTHNDGGRVLDGRTWDEYPAERNLAPV